MQKVNVKNIGGEIVKKDERYVVRDNPFGETLVLSSTFLTGGKSTSGHSHKGQEEVYIFSQGSGQMEIDDKRFDVTEGDIVCVQEGEFHRVHNTTEVGLLFICVFEGKRRH
jgi:mannose-6-phosphate isomerase-like protein (cupin superfamily)